MDELSTPNRRKALLAALAAPFVATACASAQTGGSNMSEDPTLAAHTHDWDWLVGDWTVRHRRLKERLSGSTEWEEFAGASRHWSMLGGFGNTDDNVIEIPSGTYRAMSIRAFDPETRRWAIWWLDARYPTRIEPPVYGGFRNGEGVFEGEDTLRGQPIKVRFVWSQITANSAYWEQAFSPDAGASWEVNWMMWFTRAA